MAEHSEEYGDKVICKRPPSVVMCAQIVKPTNQMKRLSIDFGQWGNNRPDWNNKQTLRLNSGETAMLLACIVGHIPECKAGFRESGLFLNIKETNKGLTLSMYNGNQQVGYICPSMSELFQIYQLGLEVMRRDGMTSKDVLDEFNFYFERYCKKL